MAAAAPIPRYFRHLIQKTKNIFGKPSKQKTLGAVCVVGGTAAVCSYLYYWKRTDGIMNKAVEAQPKRRPSEIRFIKFASTEYNGQIFMTPLDFIESLLEVHPRKRHRRIVLLEEDLEKFMKATPSPEEGSKEFFRTVRGNGIISYTDYLFLLSILTKPKSAFDIAFKMYDLDGSGAIDKKEYNFLEKILSTNWKSDREEPEQLHSIQDEDSQINANTTLMIHFFGPEGKNALNYKTFQNFMMNLQKEMLELEFNQFSHGLHTISEVDFAKILLRYTYLDTDDYEEYIDRLLDRFEDSFNTNIKMTGITYEDFENFILFLNNLNDFILAMKMYTLMNTPITKTEFQKAVLVCTGNNFSQHLVDTIFAIFDVNGDGYLSCREFLFVMKDRLHRGYRKIYPQRGWRAFKTCMIQSAKFHDIQQND